MADKTLTGKNEIFTILKEIGILLCITIVAGGLLGLVYFITMEPIQAAKDKVQQDACVAVLPEAQKFEMIAEGKDTDSEAIYAGTEYEGIVIDKVFKGLTAEESTNGYVISAITSKGYGGKINLFVGMNTEGNITGISVIEINETPGLGMRAPEELIPQFIGKGANINQFAYTKSGAAFDYQVDAISGATITTRAVTGEINAVLYYFRNKLLEGGM